MSPSCSMPPTAWATTRSAARFGKKAIEAASAIIEGLSDKDRFCIYLARDQPEALVAEPIGNKQEGLSRLKALQPGPSSSRLAPAVAAAMKALRKADARREREIHIITDNQALPGRALRRAVAETTVDASAHWKPRRSTRRPRSSSRCSACRRRKTPACVSVELQPAVVRKGARSKSPRTLMRTGPAFGYRGHALHRWQGSRRGARSTPAIPSRPRRRFTLPPLEAGVHAARIETPDDNLPIDNAFHFLIRVQDQMPSLVVGSRERHALRADGAPDRLRPPRRGGHGARRSRSRTSRFLPTRASFSAMRCRSPGRRSRRWRIM